jgi:hypothetical protein
MSSSLLESSPWTDCIRTVSISMAGRVDVWRGQSALNPLSYLVASSVPILVSSKGRTTLESCTRSESQRAWLRSLSSWWL